MKNPRRIVHLVCFALAFVLGLALPRALAEDEGVELGPLKEWPGPAKKPPPPDPCAATCRTVKAKKKKCDEAADKCGKAYDQKKSDCERACNTAATASLANCSLGDEGDSCRDAAKKERGTCRDGCGREAYNCVECAAKDTACEEYKTAKDETSCRC